MSDESKYLPCPARDNFLQSNAAYPALPVPTLNAHNSAPAEPTSAPYTRLRLVSVQSCCTSTEMGTTNNKVPPNLC